MGVHFISMKMEFILRKYYTCTTRARLFNRYTCCKIYLNAVTRYRASLCALRGVVNERNNFVFNVLSVGRDIAALWAPAERKRATMLYFANVFFKFIYLF